MASFGQKLRTLYLMEILLERTDGMLLGPVGILRNMSQTDYAASFFA